MFGLLRDQLPSLFSSSKKKQMSKKRDMRDILLRIKEGKQGKCPQFYLDPLNDKGDALPPCPLVNDQIMYKNYSFKKFNHFFMCWLK